MNGRAGNGCPLNRVLKRQVGAPRTGAQGTETLAAVRAADSPADTEGLMAEGGAQESGLT